MLVNVPSAEGLNEAALRSYFDVWMRAVEIYTDFSESHDLDVGDLQVEHAHKELWNEYSNDAQQEISHLISMLLQAIELRLKSLVAQVSPYLLLLNGSFQFSRKEAQIDFASLKTLDAIDLPRAVIALTDYELPQSFEPRFDELRRIRNRMMHLGVHEAAFEPSELIATLVEVYAILWREGEWLSNRVKYDGKSARRFFHDYEWSSPVSDAMADLRHSQALMSNEMFKTCIGAKKSSIQIFCPHCIESAASELRRELGCATAIQTGHDSAKCLMCQADLTIALASEPCSDCGSVHFVTIPQDECALVCCKQCGCY